MLPDNLQPEVKIQWLEEPKCENGPDGNPVQMLIKVSDRR